MHLTCVCLSHLQEQIKRSSITPRLVAQSLGDLGRFDTIADAARLNGIANHELGGAAGTLLRGVYTACGPPHGAAVFAETTGSADQVLTRLVITSKAVGIHFATVGNGHRGREQTKRSNEKKGCSKRNLHGEKLGRCFGKRRIDLNCAEIEIVSERGCEPVRRESISFWFTRVLQLSRANKKYC